MGKGGVSRHLLSLALAKSPLRQKIHGVLGCLISPGPQAILQRTPGRGSPVGWSLSRCRLLLEFLSRFLFPTLPPLSEHHRHLKFTALWRSAVCCFQGSPIPCSFFTCVLQQVSTTEARWFSQLCVYSVNILFFSCGKILMIPNLLSEASLSVQFRSGKYIHCCAVHLQSSLHLMKLRLYTH